MTAPDKKIAHISAAGTVAVLVITAIIWFFADYHNSDSSAHGGAETRVTVVEMGVLLIRDDIKEVKDDVKYIRNRLMDMAENSNSQDNNE